MVIKLLSNVSFLLGHINKCIHNTMEAYWLVSLDVRLLQSSNHIS